MRGENARVVGSTRMRAHNELHRGEFALRIAVRVCVGAWNCCSRVPLLCIKGAAAVRFEFRIQFDTVRVRRPTTTAYGHFSWFVFVRVCVYLTVHKLCQWCPVPVG